MEISSRAWHLRLVCWQFGTHPSNLCGYFWAVWAALALLPVAAIGWITSPLMRRLVMGLSWHTGRPEYGSTLMQEVGFKDDGIHRHSTFGLLLLALMIGPVLLIAGVMLWPEDPEIEAGWQVKIAAVGGGVFSLGTILFLWLPGLATYYGQPVYKPKAKKAPKVKKERVTKSFISIIWQYYLAKKRRVCPLITVKGDAENGTGPDEG